MAFLVRIGDRDFNVDQAPGEGPDAAQNLTWAVDALEQIRLAGCPPVIATRYSIATWQHWLIFAARPVGAAFRVNWFPLLEAWAQKYGPGLLNPDPCPIAIEG